MELLTQANKENAKRFFKFLGACDYEEDKLKENRNKLQILKFEKSNIDSYSGNIKEEDMKGITKRKDGRYMIRKKINCQTIIKYAKTLKEAQKIYSKIKNQKEIKEEKITYTFEKWAEYWLNQFKKPFLKENSFNDIKNTIKQINNNIGKYKLNELTTLLLQKYINKLNKGRTKERIQTYLNASLQKAEDLGIIKLNPFKAVIKEKKGKYKNDCYNFEEQTKIIKFIQGTEIEQEIYIYLLTGCRPNELPPKENFDFKNNIITINGTKNENALKREIEMSQSFANYIKPYIENSIRPNHNKIVKLFKELCNKANITNANLYRLRHTFASNHLRLGTNIKLIQSWLGHSEIELTLKVYTDFDKTSTKEKIRELYKNFYYEIE